MKIPEPKYFIGNYVYHITKESPQGVVLDVIWSMHTNQFEYVVTFSPESTSYRYYEHELSFEKRIV